MAKEVQAPGLESIAGAARRAGAKGLPPVHLWNPPYCGDIDMRIAGDGTWFYQKTPIGRAALVKLFASVLKREGDQYYLVTPVEKCGIRVHDAPFLAVEMAVEDGAEFGPPYNGQSSGPGRVLTFRTKLGVWVACGPENSLVFEPGQDTGRPKPYL